MFNSIFSAPNSSEVADGVIEYKKGYGVGERFSIPEHVVKRNRGQQEIVADQG